MSGFMTANNEHLIRSNVWGRQIRELLLDDLYAMQFVKVLGEFPDGTTFNMPSLGEAEQSDFVEGQAVKYSRMDTGNFTFSFDKYKYSANAISEKFKRDSFYSQEVISAFVPRQHRVIMEGVETVIFGVGPTGQTASDLNAINGAAHRWVGTGPSNSIALKDFARVQYGMQKANVPMRNLVAVLDPSVAFTIQTQTNLQNLLSPQPEWQDLTKGGLMSGFRFKFNIYGFDCYVSNYLKRDYSETINSTAVTNGVANLFFSAAPGDTLPIIGGFRQQPTVYSEFEKDLQQTEYLTICEYGFKLYRPENMFVILTDTTVVA